MASTHDNNLSDGFRGRVGKVVFSKRNGKTVASKRRSPASSSTPAQMAVQDRFKEASLYAKDAMADPVVKDFYQSLAAEGRSAYSVALTDYLKPPNIRELDNFAYDGSVGSTLRILVTDNCKVSAVRVRIETAAGSFLEEGMATPHNGASWIYTATVANPTPAGSKVTVTARDMPQNSSVKQFNL